MATKRLTTAAVLAVLGVACNGSAADSHPTAEPVPIEAPAANVTASPTSVTAPPALPVVASESDIDPDIADLWDHLGVATPTEAAVSRSAAIDEVGIGECMRAVGFDYTPESDEPASFDLRFGLSDENFAATYGFGLAAGHLGELPVLSGSDSTGGAANEPYLQTLSPGQRSAFQAAYQDCRQQHSRPYIDGWGTALDEFRGLLASDQRIVNAAAEWSGCMATAGFQYPSLQALYDDIAGQLSQSASNQARRQIQQTELLLAIANVACEPSYREMYRTVAAERIGEFQALLIEPSGGSPGGQG
ncbi:MAG TPA: hypothetical protein VNQ73_01240 [Ilumatobacter sp.]|nr:hypothetical protein [Ilumatobacter sp.]